MRCTFVDAFWRRRTGFARDSYCSHSFKKCTYRPTRRMSNSCGSASDWRVNLVTTDEEASALTSTFRTVAVLGIKTERQSEQPAFFVAQYLDNAGVKVVPVPVFYPDVTEILGRPVVRTVTEAAKRFGPLDCVDVFRRPSDVLQHVDDILAASPRCVWLQSGIRCPEAEEAWARAGILVVADKCLKVLYRRPRL